MVFDMLVTSLFTGIRNAKLRFTNCNVLILVNDDLYSAQLSRVWNDSLLEAELSGTGGAVSPNECIQGMVIQPSESSPETNSYRLRSRPTIPLGK